MAARMRGKRARLGALAAACAAMLALAVALGVTQGGDAPGATAQTATTTPTTATTTTPTTALPANPPTCTARTLGVSRTANPGLAADCDTLLAIKSTLRVTGWLDYDRADWRDHGDWLNWSAAAPIRFWKVVTMGGTPQRVTGLDFSDTRESVKVYHARLRRYVDSEHYTRHWTLRGVIPTQLGNLTALETLDLGGSELTGAIPTQLGSLTKLTRLDLSDNRLTGNIPTQLGSLTALTALDLSDNTLSGSIPTHLGSLTALTALDLSDNSLTGSIPTQLGNLTALTALDLSDNSLTGSIPTQLGSLTALTALDLSDNTLSGSIPTQLGGITALANLAVSGNSFAGCVPNVLWGVADKDLPDVGLDDCTTPTIKGTSSSSLGSGTYSVIGLTFDVPSGGNIVIPFIEFPLCAEGEEGPCPSVVIVIRDANSGSSLFLGGDYGTEFARRIRSQSEVSGQSDVADRVNDLFDRIANSARLTPGEDR